MLVLAVFCGFLAENKREHIIEGHRAKEYAHSLIQDLSSDTAIVQRQTWMTKKIISYLDSVADIIGSNRIWQVKGSQLYHYGRFCNSGLQVLWRNATLEQVKNSGGLRYFRDFSLVKKISEYYSKTKEIDSRYEMDLTRIVAATELRDRIFRSDYLQPYTRLYFSIPISTSDSLRIDSLKDVAHPLQSYDPDLLNHFANLCLTRRLNLIIALDDYQIVSAMAGDLIVQLKKEYHLK